MKVQKRYIIREVATGRRWYKHYRGFHDTLATTYAATCGLDSAARCVLYFKSGQYHSQMRNYDYNWIKTLPAQDVLDLFNPGKWKIEECVKQDLTSADAVV